MKHLRLISIALLLSLVIPTLTVFAQGGGKTEWDTFTSDDKMISFNYPKGWIVTADSEVPFPAYWIANSEDTMTRLSAPGNVPPISGDVGLIVLLLPTEILPVLKVDVPADVTPGDLALALVTVLTTPSVSTDPVPTYGKPEEVPLTDQPDAIMAGRVSVTRNDSEGVFTVFTLKDGIIAVSYVATFLGEFTQDMSDMGLAFAASIAYEGTTQDLIDAMNATATPEAATPAAALDGNALVSERCTVCHSRDRIDAKVASGADLAAWTKTVDRMIGKGAQLNADERQAVLDYLTGTN